MESFQSRSPVQTPLRAFATLTPFTSPLMPRSPNTQTPSSTQIPSKIFDIPLSPPPTPKSISLQRTRLQHGNQEQTTRQTLSTGETSQRRRQNPNPLLQGTEAQKRKRRERYLNRVHGDREEARWNVRSDQILYQDFLTQRRAWETEQARLAPEYETDYFEIYEDDEVFQHDGAQPVSSDRMNSGSSQDASNMAMNDVEIEDILAKEAQELDALVSMHEEPTNKSFTDYYAPCSSPRYGSEDEEFEDMLCALSQSDAMNEDMDIS